MAACPYCGTILSKSPQRKTKCRSCGEQMYVRDGAPVTLARAESIDWLRLLALTDRHFADTERILSERFHSPAGHRDVLWALLNESLLRDPSGATHKGVYFLMARFVREEGRDPNTYLLQAHDAELRHWQRVLPGRQLRVKIMSLGSASCPDCAPLNDRIFTIPDALAQRPIPVSTCTNDIEPRSGKGWCRCSYLLDTDSM